MIHSKRLFMKYPGFFVGIGGMKCPCCVPPSKRRKKLSKVGRKRLNQMVFKIEREQE